MFIYERLKVQQTKMGGHLAYGILLPIFTYTDLPENKIFHKNGCY